MAMFDTLHFNIQYTLQLYIDYIIMINYVNNLVIQYIYIYTPVIPSLLTDAP